jgi:hypothetical protein
VKRKSPKAKPKIRADEGCSCSPARPLHLVKKPRTMPGLSGLGFGFKSVGSDRSAELVVQARGEEIDILRNMVGNEESGG